MTDVAIGIDIGGTKIAAGAVDTATGRVIHEISEPTPVAGGGEAVLATCQRLATTFGRDIRAIGIGVPELVGPDGRVHSAYQFDWRSLDLPAAFPQHTVVVESDVRAAAVAEARWGAATSVTSALYVSIGTGISSCFLIEGRPWRGHRGNALVLTSGELTVLDPVSGALVHSVVEEIAAGPSIAGRYAAMHGDRADTASVLARAERGDDDARHVVQTAASVLGSAIGQAVNVLDPEIVVIGGGLGLAGGAWKQALHAAIRQAIWSEQTRTLPILPAALGTRAGLIGAALIAAGTPYRIAQEVA